MTWLGILLGCIVTWALWSPSSFGAHLAKIATGYRRALEGSRSDV